MVLDFPTIGIIQRVLLIVLGLVPFKEIQQILIQNNLTNLYKLLTFICQIFMQIFLQMRSIIK